MDQARRDRYRRGRVNERGYSLAEVLVALFLIGIGVLAAAPALVSSMKQNATGADLGRVGAVAITRMELLRSIPFHDLFAGGSLNADQAGYYDDSDPEVGVRWEIVDGGGPPGVRTIRVRAEAVRQSIGLPKSIELTLVRSR